METSWVVLGAAVDYVTATAKNRAGIAILKNMFDAQAAHLERQGFHVKPSKPMGYDGWQVGAWFGGARTDGFMMRVSGQDAHLAAAALRGADVHITRLDVQATLKAIPTRPDWAAWAAMECQRRRLAAVQCNWANVRHLNAFGKGDTLTVGSRQSEKYGRLYDKEAESMDPAYEAAWRYELEYKGSYALAALEAIYGATDPFARCLELVAAQYRAWCVPFPELISRETNPLVIDRQRTDIERKLAWLKKQVMPTMRELVQLGYDKELDDFIKAVYDVSGPMAPDIPASAAD